MFVLMELVVLQEQLVHLVIIVLSQIPLLSCVQTAHIVHLVQYKVTLVLQTPIVHLEQYVHQDTIVLTLHFILQATFAHKDTIVL